MSLRPPNRTEAQKKAYKMGVDPDDTRRRREDNLVEIRKNKREDNLLKKRPEVMAIVATLHTPGTVSQSVSASSVETRVLVIRANEPPPQCNTRAGSSTHSKLLRAETPLRRHGRRNAVLSDGTTNTRSGSDPHMGREVVAYDDIF